MARMLPAGNLAYEVISGVSVGAINLSGFSTFPIGMEIEATQWLVDQWSPLERDNLWKFWPATQIF